MTPLSIASVLLAAVISASPVVEIRQTFIDTQSIKTLQITNIDWQRSNSTINAVQFQATLPDTGETWRCTSSDSANTEGFVPTNIDRCAKGSPMTFTWDDNHLRIWLTTGDKSYAGSVEISPLGADKKVASLNEIEVTPTTTPNVDS
ncbi:hypothetical protein ONS95_008663 [Cadophora gregata]|uniref:uncharacterized protein n=1 Tax=Cadophora gregata TaxID=51156 RepID=UPI0026DC0A0A|nr:uncharacterized protein ONS95_008663 [Cadophora gregata]KAK0123651.1 hypothetical protein ONS95_008663 [Cadophora gregata]KAK0129993.1 hypothetical protein ONS96_000531 [Cadophora gregata f. sp. sojae]